MATSEKQKALDYAGEDIISNLPDGIPSHILSFLPIKEAARTSLLSKRWRYVWTCITNLDFNDESQYKLNAPIAEKQKFLELVNRILRHQITISSIHSFTLHLWDSTVQYPSDDLNALICHVLEKNVQKLSVSIAPSIRVPIFPCAVFNSRSLIELDINMLTSLKFPSSNWLTNLRVLRFCRINFFQDFFSCSKELMFSFPVLKVFEIDNCTLFDVKGLILDAPMLESLVIRYPQFMERLANKSSRVSGTMKLFALRLRKFFYYRCLKDCLILSNPLTVLDALIELDIKMLTGLRFPSSHCLTNLRVLRFYHIDFPFDCFSNSKELMLSFPFLKVFEVDNCTFFDVKGVIIEAPMLESFAIRYPQFMERLANKSSRVSGIIKLFALHLRKFFYCGDLGDGNILCNPLTVIDACINVEFSNLQEEEVQKTGVKGCTLLKELHESVKFLELGPCIISTLAHLKDDSLLRLPIFERLVSLVLASWNCAFFDILLKLLQKLPNLHTLELNAYESHFGTPLSSSKESHFGTTLSSSKEVPHCVQCNLEVVIIRLSEWDESKVRFAKYVLENAQVLNQLTIRLKAGVRKVIKELLSIPKASSSTQIEVKSTAWNELKELGRKYN